MDEISVVPGERIATEEEFTHGTNTYVENGAIYSLVFGQIEKKDGAINVVSGTGREVRMFDKGMVVIGTVTDDMRSVIFIKLDHIEMGRKDYLALKDGKIIPEKPRPGRGPMGGRGGFGRESQSAEREKLCAIGDTILGRILYNDQDSYALGLREPELGVIYAKCSMCGSEMGYDRDSRLLVCNECGSREKRKVSLYYGAPEKIKALFA